MADITKDFLAAKNIMFWTGQLATRHVPNRALWDELGRRIKEWNYENTQREYEAIPKAVISNVIHSMSR